MRIVLELLLRHTAERLAETGAQLSFFVPFRLISEWGKVVGWRG